MIRHKLIPLLGVIGFGLLATACSSSTPATTVKPIQLRIWRLNQDIDPIRSIINDFKHQNSNVVVTYIKKTTPDTYETDALKSLAARQGPDIWSIPNDTLGDEEQTVVPLPTNYFWKKGATSGNNPVTSVQQLYPQGISEQIITTDGKQVLGLPTNVDALQLYYNPDLFRAAATDFRTSLGKNPSDSVLRPVQTLLSKAPATWDILMSQAKYLTKRSDSSANDLTRSAIALGTSNNIDNAQDILELLMLQNGNQVVSSDHKTALFHTTEVTPTGTKVRPGERALDFYTSFADPNRENYSWNPSMPSVIDAFAQGQVAMVIAYSDFAQQLKVKYPKFRPSVTSVPQISLGQTPVNFIRFQVESVTQTADSPAAAFGFLTSYTSQATANTLANALKLRTPYLVNLQRNTSDSLSQAILTGKSVYKKKHVQFDQIMKAMITDVSQNGITTDQSIDTAAQKINDLLSTPVATPTP